MPTLRPLVSALVPRLLLEQSYKRTGDKIYGSHVILSSKAQSHRACAQFDENCDIQSPEEGQVKVTTVIIQDVDDKSDFSTKGLRMS